MRLAGAPDEAAEAARFRKMVWVSLLLHGGAAAVFALGPLPFTDARTPEFRVVEVRMVTIESPNPAPAPAPRPPKPPPPPPETKVVIPEELRQIPEFEPEPEPEPEPVEQTPEPEPEPAPREEPPPQETAPAEEHSLDSALDALRSELGDPGPPDAPVDVAPTAPSTGTRLLSAEEARYVSIVKRRVRRNFVVAPGFRGQPLETQVKVFLGADGEVRDIDITRRSGNPWFDQSVERALRRSSPLPPPPDPGPWPFVFTPEDAL